MSLCPSSSHQLVAAAIAFRRARRKFPKDFGLESAVKRASGDPRESSAKEGTCPAKAETATTREGPINQAKSSSSLRRACSSRSDHVCPANVRCRDHDRFCSEESSIGCNCCRIRNDVLGENLAELRSDCSGGDAVPGRECHDQSALTSSSDRKHEFAKPAEQDRYDVTSRTVNSEAAKATECNPQSARSAFCHHRKARCSSKLCSSLDATKLLYDYTPREKNDKIACGDSSGDRSKEFPLTSCHETFIDLDDNAEEIVSSDAVSGSATEDWMTRLNASRNHCRKIANSSCHCEYQYQGSTVDLSCDCHHHHDHHRDCLHWYCCCQQHEDSLTNANECETSCGIYGGKAQHKSWREQMRGEDGRLYARQRCSNNYPGIISAAREENEELEEHDESDNEEDDEEEDIDEDDNDDDNVDEEDEDGVAVINHKDSMCILAEKYKASRKIRAKRGAKEGRNKSRDKSQTSEIVDQPQKSPRKSAVPHEESAKHACRAARCGGCSTPVRAYRDRERRHAPPEGEYERLKCPLNGTRCCSSRAPCGRTF